MDIKIWEKTIVTWLNSLSNSSPITDINQINEFHLKEVIKQININFENSSLEFLKDVFPNFTDNNVLRLNLGVDFLCASTLLLIYVSLSKNENVNDLKNLMCKKLDTSIQLIIVEFLNSIQEYEDVFKFSFNKFKKEIFPQVFFNFKEKHLIQNSVIGDGDKTPVKNEDSNHSFSSPLQGFFQTPKKSATIYTKKCFNMCGDGDHIKRIKKLSDQLVEEESEKTSLQEQLIKQTQKCNDIEIKLRSKIEEINTLKEDWAKDIKKNEEEMNLLKNTITKKVESEKKFKGEIAHLENYVSKLESDFSDIMLKNDKLEVQLKTTIEKFTLTEAQLKEATELCEKLQSTINEKEKELIQFKENYENCFHDQSSIDVTFMNGSFDKSVCSPENLGVVVDKLLREKIEENDELQETIESLRADKNCLQNELKSLKDQLEIKSLIVSELQFLKKELNKKTESFENSEKELFRLQNELVAANAEISRLTKENSHLTEKYNILNNKLKEREQVLINCNNAKMLLQINFLKLAEDFKAVQQLLEVEVKSISGLMLGKSETQPKIEVYDNFKEACELKDSKNILSVRSLNSSQNELNILGTKSETTSVYSLLLPNDKLVKFLDTSENLDCQLDWMESKASLQKTYYQLNDNIILLKAKIQELQEQHKNSLEAKSRLELNLEEAKEKMSKIQSDFASDIKRLEQLLQEKEDKIKKLERSNIDFQKKEEEALLHKEPKVLVKAPINIDVNRRIEPKNIQKTFSTNNFADPKEKIAAPSERQEFNDSLEEIPVINKTFDIVNLEEKNISDKTFSIAKEVVDTTSKNLKGGSAWVVSPPSKVPVKIPSKEVIRRSESKSSSNESWIVPIGPLQAKQIKPKKVSSSVNDLRVGAEDLKISELKTELMELTKECDRLRNALLDSEQKRKKEKEMFEKNQEIIRQNITSKYETQLEHLKSEMKQLYNRELAKHKEEQTKVNSELRDQNKRYKEHIDELRNQLWDLGEKLLQEQTLKRDLERNLSEMKEKYENLMFSREAKLITLHASDSNRSKEPSTIDESARASLRQIPNATFPIIPNEDEEEIFDNRFLEDMKTGVCKVERPEERLKELQYRNSLCLPHLKSSYPGETQFHNPTLFKESELKFGALPFGQESQSLTDSDHSMTKSLLPDPKGKKKEQTSYKKPGPPTPSKNGGRLSIQGGDLRLTPRNVLKELNDQNDRNRGTPNPLKLFLSSKNIRRGSMGGKDENMAPVTPRKKKFFRKPFGARD